MSDSISREEWTARKVLKLLENGQGEEAAILFAMFGSMYGPMRETEGECQPMDNASDAETFDE